MEAVGTGFHLFHPTKIFEWNTFWISFSYAREKRPLTFTTLSHNFFLELLFRFRNIHKKILFQPTAKPGQIAFFVQVVCHAKGAKHLYHTGLQTFLASKIIIKNSRENFQLFFHFMNKFWTFKSIFHLLHKFFITKKSFFSFFINKQINFFLDLFFFSFFFLKLKSSPRTTFFFFSHHFTFFFFSFSAEIPIDPSRHIIITLFGVYSDTLLWLSASLRDLRRERDT